MMDLYRPNFIKLAMGALAFSTALVMFTFATKGWTYWIGYFLLPLNIAAFVMNFRNLKKWVERSEKFLSNVKVLKLKKQLFGKCFLCMTFGSMSYILAEKEFERLLKKDIETGKLKRGQWGTEIICSRCALLYAI